jgi:hypothetical protein
MPCETETETGDPQSFPSEDERPVHTPHWILPILRMCYTIVSHPTHVNAVTTALDYSTTARVQYNLPPTQVVCGINVCKSGTTATRSSPITITEARYTYSTANHPMTTPMKDGSSDSE